MASPNPRHTSWLPGNVYYQLPNLEQKCHMTQCGTIVWLHMGSASPLWVWTFKPVPNAPNSIVFWGCQTYPDSLKTLFNNQKTHLHLSLAPTASHYDLRWFTSSLQKAWRSCLGEPNTNTNGFQLYAFLVCRPSSFKNSVAPLLSCVNIRCALPF